VPAPRFKVLGAGSTGDAMWRFSDGKEAFTMRGKPEEIQRMSAALAAATPAVPHGKCSESGMRSLLGRPVVPHRASAASR